MSRFSEYALPTYHVKKIKKRKRIRKKLLLFLISLLVLAILLFV